MPHKERTITNASNSNDYIEHLLDLLDQASLDKFNEDQRLNDTFTGKECILAMQ